MKFKFLLLFVLFILFVSIISVFLFKTDKEPKIHFLNGNVFNFDSVLEGKQVKHRFFFQNKGGENLVFGKVITGCGCTGAELSSQSIAPNETGYIELSYTGRPLKTMESLVAIFETNDPQNKLAKVMMNGRVELSVFWYPQSVSFLSECNNICENNVVNFPDLDKYNVEVDSVLTSSEKIKAIFNKKENNGECCISISDNCPKGNWNENVKIKCLTSFGEKIINIPVYLMVH